MTESNVLILDGKLSNGRLSSKNPESNTDPLQIHESRCCSPGFLDFFDYLLSFTVSFSPWKSFLLMVFHFYLIVWFSSILAIFLFFYTVYLILFFSSSLFCISPCIFSFLFSRFSLYFLYYLARSVCFLLFIAGRFPNLWQQARCQVQHFLRLGDHYPLRGKS